jgi:hypothetical protein
MNETVMKQQVILAWTLSVKHVEWDIAGVKFRAVSDGAINGSHKA